MVEPVTICIAVAVSISTAIGLLYGANEVYKNRFRHHIMDCYEVDDPEYPTLFAILSHPGHVENSMIRKRDQRRLDPSDPNMPKVKTISDICRFREKTDLYPEKLYRCWMVHDKEEGVPCIRVFYFTNTAMEHFQERLFEDKISPDRLVLEGCSKR